MNLGVSRRAPKQRHLEEYRLACQPDLQTSEYQRKWFACLRFGLIGRTIVRLADHGSGSNQVPRSPA